MQYSYIPYGVVAIICAIALIHFAANIKQYGNNTRENCLYRYAILASAVCAMMEFCFVFHESRIITNLVFCYASEITYSLASIAAGLFWFLCSETEQQSKSVCCRRNAILCTLPMFLMAVIDLTTFWHHLLFSFTPEGKYVRGILSTPFVVITALYIMKSGFCAFFRSFKSEYYLKRKNLLTFFYYAIGIIIAQVFQIVLGSVLPFRIIGAVIVFFLVQENIIKENIFTDILTGANNRTAMNKYLKENFFDSDENFTMVMIDIDCFKQINDQYGHIVGDTALKVFTDAFINSVPSQLFFGRYGGDEFVIIGQIDTSDELESVIHQAESSIQELCKINELPFCLSFSYGSYKKGTDVATIPDLINKADAEMYKMKKSR